MTFGMITCNQHTEKKQNYMTWIQTTLKSYIKSEDIYVYIAKDVEIRFDISNYESER